MLALNDIGSDVEVGSQRINQMVGDRPEVFAMLQEAMRPVLWPVLQRLSCPTLVVWGMDSDVLSEAQARHMVEVLLQGELMCVPSRERNNAYGGNTWQRRKGTVC
jgi:pimeloyl-ACP methyl ester carboxylesterase